MDEPMTSPDTATRWRQVSLWCRDWQAAEQMAVTGLAPHLVNIEREQTITSWWFVRKSACWRIRYLATPGQDTGAITAIHQVVHQLAAAGAVQRWAATLYEPERHVFGSAMDLAHDLFAADTHHLLNHLRQHPGQSAHRRELGLLLGTALVRGAWLDWYEQGDVWARVAAHRTTNPPADTLLDRATDDVRRLITATSSSLLADAPGWPAAFARTGQHLAALTHQGELTRGLRAVLAHHILFAWNRAGIPAEHQALLATTAARVAFHTDPTHLGDLIGRLAGPVSAGRGDYPASGGHQHHHSQP